MSAPLESSLLPACITLTLAVAKALSAYRVCALDADDAPSAFTFEGSNDAVSWVELDWRTDEVFADNECRDFPVVSAVAYKYKYYRLRIIETTSGTALILSVELYERIPSIVGHGEAESESGCEDAIRLATDAAEADAATDLAAHCRQLFTATASRTLPCESGIGTVTGNGSGASFISQADALQQAEDEADAKATALLAQCASSNNTLAITIPDSGIASPYPSVQNVEGSTGTITSVTVNINGLSHGSIEDVQIVLKSPAGTVVELMRRCGGTNSVGGADQSGPISPGINLVFDDAAGSFLPDNAAFVAGTYKPSQYGVATNMTAPAPQGPYGTALSDFDGETANGAWTLWVIDRVPQFRGAIYSGWSVNIVTA